MNSVTSIRGVLLLLVDSNVRPENQLQNVVNVGFEEFCLALAQVQAASRLDLHGDFTLVNLDGVTGIRGLASCCNRHFLFLS